MMGGEYLPREFLDAWFHGTIKHGLLYNLGQTVLKNGNKEMLKACQSEGISSLIYGDWLEGPTTIQLLFYSVLNQDVCQLRVFEFGTPPNFNCLYWF